MASGSSGRRRRRRIDSGELRWPATERRWWRRCRASGGPWVGGEEGGGRGGAFERIGEARGGRWPRGSSSAAASVFGEVGNGERGSRGGVREVGRIGTSPGIHPRGQGKQEVARGSRRWPRQRRRAPRLASVRPPGRGGRGQGGGGGLGRPDGAGPGGPGGLRR